jgi:outer membrane protein
MSCALHFRFGSSSDDGAKHPFISVQRRRVLGSERRDIYSLQDDSPAALEPAPEDAEPLVQLAFRSRPDLAALNEDYIAANRLTTATRELWLPTASAIVASGGTPDRSNSILTSWYAAAGANIDVPLFNGFLYNARAREAELREGAAQERVRDLRDVIARDVRAAVLSAQTNFQRIAVSEELLKESNLALELAKDRYQLGLSGIIELSQAQLAQTQAEIGNANARYLYRISQATIRYQTGQ